jgi:enterochelin esterase-like enzyme
MILDNLIGQGKARPMIVVMPNGNSNQIVSQGYALGAPSATTGLPAPPAKPVASPAPVPGFPDSIVKDIIPYLEKHYRAGSAKGDRAICGLSMGGGHTLTATNSYPGTFGYIGVFSSGVRTGSETLTKQLEAVKAAGVSLYYVGCGIKDPLAYSGSQVLVETLRKLGFSPEFRETPGGHTWANWRIYLSDFAPRLFR